MLYNTIGNKQQIDLNNLITRIFHVWYSMQRLTRSSCTNPGIDVGDLTQNTVYDSLCNTICNMLCNMLCMLCNMLCNIDCHPHTAQRTARGSSAPREDRCFGPGTFHSESPGQRRAARRQAQRFRGGGREAHHGSQEASCICRPAQCVRR